MSRHPPANPLGLATAQQELLELVIELQRCDHRLHRLSRLLPIPLDNELMGEDRLPHDLGMHLYAVISTIRQDALSDVINRLYKAAHTDDASLRRDYYVRRERGEVP